MNEEMRKEFEAAVLSGYLLPVNSVRRNYMDCRAGDYESVLTNVAWLAWQASREAMKPVKLPTKMKNTESSECYYYNDAIDECKEAIEQSGYKVAE